MYYVTLGETSLLSAPDISLSPAGLQTVIRALDGAYEKIDHAIAQALYAHKPVLIQVACNMASLTHPLFEKQPVPFSLTGKTTNEVWTDPAAYYLHPYGAAFFSAVIKTISPTPINYASYLVYVACVHWIFENPSSRFLAL